MACSAIIVAEFITTDLRPASARTMNRTGFKIPKAAQLNAMDNILQGSYPRNIQFMHKLRVNYTIENPLSFLSVFH